MTDIFGKGREEINIYCSDFSDSKTFQIDAVKNEPRETDISTYGSFYNSFSSETDFVDHKHATDSYQEQNEEKFDVNNLKQENFDLSKSSDNLSTCDAIQIKNEDDVDIFLEDIKRETGVEKSNESFIFCQVFHQNFGNETDFFKSTSYRSECSCQNENECHFFNICGEDMSVDVKSSFHDLIADPELKSREERDETISAEVIKDSFAASRRLSMSPMENDNKMKCKFYSQPLSVAEKQNRCKCSKFHCKICSKSYSRVDNLKVHERIHSDEKPYCCKICSKYFRRIDCLKIHERTHNNETPFYCKICSKYFTRMDNLKLHERVHTGEKPFHCKNCSKSFSRMYYLKVHERSHTGEKPFHCKICSESFSQKRALVVHEKSHTGETPFYCKICSKYFTRIDGLKIHGRVHTGEKPFHCKICSKAFTTSSELKVHGRIHTGEKPFHCKTCSKTFSQGGTMKVHERSHTGEKPFHCKVCSKAFTNSSDLKVHGRIHTREKTFHCKICSKTFANPSGLRKHRKFHPGENH